MIQYDRVLKAFVLADKTAAQLGQAGLDACTKLNRALADVHGWLDVKRSSGKFSHCFLAELTINSMDRRFPLFAIYDEIGMLEGTDNRRSMTKKPRQMRAPLKGLWHKHYYDAGFLVRNLMDETERMVKDGRWEAMFAPHYGKYLHEFMDQITHKMVDGAYEKRARDQRITGEFIVYERLPDGSNYYLTLGTHGEWEAIRARVDKYRTFDAGA